MNNIDPIAALYAMDQMMKRPEDADDIIQDAELISSSPTMLEDLKISMEMERAKRIIYGTPKYDRNDPMGAI
jgi:hypothetical protein